MRIIAGSAKGTRIVPPTDRSVRPTLDRVREACFSILGPSLAGARFLDLFAGTGANALEALSRGAEHADLVDLDRHAREVIAENIRRTRMERRATIRAFALPAGLRRLQGKPPYDIIYADPPHTFTDHAGLLTAILDTGILTPGGVIVLEHATKTAAPRAVGALTCVRDAVYGATTLSLYRFEEIPGNAANEAASSDATRNADRP
jgi:16S rRNA (guanine966-N2)-methyltransferase